MTFRVSLLITFLLFAAFGGLRPNLATTDGRSTTMPKGSAIIAYWQTMLPHSTMPPAIRDLLIPNDAEADGDNGDENLYDLPVSAFYRKGTNRNQNLYDLPVSAFYGKGTNADKILYDLPVSAFYGKGNNGDKNLYDLPVSAFYEKGINGGKNLYDLPVSAFYGKGTNGDKNLYDLPVSAFYGKGTNEDKNLYDLPVSAFYGKGTNGDKNLYDLPISAFYGKGTNGDKNLYDLPISAFYGKGTNDDKNLYDLPISAFYRKEVNNLKPTIFYRKGTDEDSNPLPVSAFYGKEVNNLNSAIFHKKGANAPVHVSISNMADADHHHVHEHRHIHGGHDHFHSRNTGFLFLEDALTPGSKVAPYIDPASSRGAPLLPRDVADSIPMSRRSFTAILRMFAPVSRAMAESIWRSLELCEHPRPIIKGEKRGCVTSIESMVDFVASTLGTSDLRALSSPSVPVEGRNASKVYTVVAARAITSPGDTMTCHGIPFPYKVFLCHALVPTKVYSVTVESDDDEKETMVEALVVCHLDTAELDPVNMPPHVKPGDAPVCHFLNNDDVLWAPAATTLEAQAGAADVVVVADQ